LSFSTITTVAAGAVAAAIAPSKKATYDDNPKKIRRNET